MQAHGYQPRRRSPVGLAIVIAVHGAAITALMLTKMEMPIKSPIPRIEAIFVPNPIDPPEVEPQPVEAETPVQRPAAAEPIARDLPKWETQQLSDVPVYPTFDPFPTGTMIDPPIATPTPEPVRAAARIDDRSVLQPPYPTSEARLGVEGAVKVRVTIGVDGRVRAVEKIAAASEALFRATRRHALGAWRFRPATVDGRPVESSQVMTVIFRLQG